MKFLILFLISLNCFSASLADQYKIISGQAITATFNSNPIDIEEYSGISITSVVSSSAAISGSLKLQASNDFVNSNSIVNWVDVPSSSNAVSGNSAFLWNISQAYYRWLRIVYTHTSGSAVLDANYNLKK